MHAITERQVVADLAMNIEIVCSLTPLSLIVVGGAVDEKHRAACGHALAVALKAIGNKAGLYRGWRFKTQRLFDSLSPRFEGGRPLPR